MIELKIVKLYDNKLILEAVNFVPAPSNTVIKFSTNGPHLYTERV